MNYQNELTEIKQILSQIKPCPNPLNQNERREEAKENKLDDEYEGGESNSFSRIKPYE